MDSRCPWLWACHLTLVALCVSGCSGATRPAADQKALTAGFIYIGPRDDFGYSQAHAAGAQAVKRMPGVEVVEEESVPDTVDVQTTMKSMIELDGARIIFATSFNYYDPHMLKLARENPGVTFLHCGGLWDPARHPENISTYFGYIDECEYLSGIVAGHMTASKRLGFVAGKPIPQVLRNINAFILGARSVDPSITCHVIFTGTWTYPVKEAEAANRLIDQGVDVLTCHVNSPKIVIETAEKRGIYSCGYHACQQSLAPRGYLTGAEWNWEKVYVDYVADLQAGKKLPHLVRGGLREGIVRPSPYGPAVTAAARLAADNARARLEDQSLRIFRGPLRTNDGKVILQDGQSYDQRAVELEKMDYLVDGVIGR